MNDIPKRKISCGLWILVACVLLVGFSVFSLIFVASAGNVTGQEFSPYTFEVRRFEYIRLPFFGNQLVPIEQNSNLNNSVASYLRSQNLIPTGSQSDSNTWHLVQDNVTAPESKAFDAAILVEYLRDTDSDGTFIWQEWTIGHPELSHLLWPIIGMSAQANEYLLMPEMFRAAKSAESHEDLSQELKEILDRYLEERSASANETDQAKLDSLESRISQFIDDYEPPEETAEKASTADEFE